MWPSLPVIQMSSLWRPFLLCLQFATHPTSPFLPPFLGGGSLPFYLFSPSNPTMLSTQHQHTQWLPQTYLSHVFHLGRKDIFRFTSQPPCPPVATTAAFLSFPSLVSFFSVFLLPFLTLLSLLSVFFLLSLQAVVQTPRDNRSIMPYCDAQPG